MSFDLDQRSGFPGQWLELLARHPRDTWRGSSSAVVRFWLDRHDAFRRQSSALVALAADYRAEHLAAPDLAARAAPALWGLLAPLDGHHQIEDFHYFPHFRETEPRLARGFEVLERDHRALHVDIEHVVQCFNALSTAVEQGGGQAVLRMTGDAYVGASLGLERRLRRHLNDEEDLIIPLMLERD